MQSYPALSSSRSRSNIASLSGNQRTEILGNTKNAFPFYSSELSKTLFFLFHFIKEGAILAKVRVEDIIKKFDLEIISGKKVSIVRLQLVISHVPGLGIGRFFNYYPADRIQLLGGMTEITFCQKLDPEDRRIRLEKLCNDITPGILSQEGWKFPKN